MAYSCETTRRARAVESVYWAVWNQGMMAPSEPPYLCGFAPNLSLSRRRVRCTRWMVNRTAWFASRARFSDRKQARPANRRLVVQITEPVRAPAGESAYDDRDRRLLWRERGSDSAHRRQPGCAQRPVLPGIQYPKGAAGQTPPFFPRSISSARSFCGSSASSVSAPTVSERVARWPTK